MVFLFNSPLTPLFLPTLMRIGQDAWMTENQRGVTVFI